APAWAAVDGALDSSYSTDGKATVNFSSATLDQALGAALTPDGKLVLVGRAKPASGDAVAWTRLLNDGSIDPDWGGTTVALCGNTGSQQLNDVAIQSTGDAIAVGSCTVGGTTVGVVVRIGAAHGTKVAETIVDFALAPGADTVLNAVAIAAGDL